MIAIFDVDYRADGTAVAACVTADDWADAAPVGEYTTPIPEVAPYEPGQFYKRELPCLLAVIATLPGPPTVCVVDGYVWLGDENTPGLGAHLFNALGGMIPVVGVAKTRFAGAEPVAEVLHGATETTRPLYVSAVGVPLADAAEAVRRMHGTFRLPTLIKRVDSLCRSGRL
ncbi:MAG: endonuclease V [Akkermansiaceae bacterium]|nr:endonuclease V [Armatimonadota bacterium]